jgi:3-hydroxy-D-aspartate aldolase
MSFPGTFRNLGIPTPFAAGASAPRRSPRPPTRPGIPATSGPPRHRMPDDHRAGTGSFEFETVSGVYTELRCGSCIFMDADYGPQPRPRRRPDQGLRPEPLRLDDGDEPPDRGPRHRRRRPQGIGLRLRSAPRLRRARRHLRARLRRARPPRHLRRHQPAATRSASSPAIATRPSTSTDWYVGIRASRVEQLWPITAGGAVY